jgi:hypothetical protein
VTADAHAIRAEVPAMRNVAGQSLVSGTRSGGLPVSAASPSPRQPIVQRRQRISSRRENSRPPQASRRSGNAALNALFIID